MDHKQRQSGTNCASLRAADVTDAAVVEQPA
jgi:hypothetical protein